MEGYTALGLPLGGNSPLLGIVSSQPQGEVNPRDMPSRTAGRAAAAKAAPAAPQRKRTSKLDQIIRRLNEDYGLEIIIPDLASAPAQHPDEEYRRCHEICNLLTNLDNRRDGSLNRALVSYLNEARAESHKWPRPIPTCTRSSPAPPKATSAGEKLRLQEVLLEHLQRCTTIIPSPHPVDAPVTANATGSQFQSQASSNSQQSQLSYPINESIPGNQYCEQRFAVRFDTPSSPVPEMDTLSQICGKRPSDGEQSPSETASKKRKGKGSATSLLMKPPSAWDTLNSRRHQPGDSDSNASSQNASSIQLAESASDGDDESEIPGPIKVTSRSQSQQNSGYTAPFGPRIKDESGSQSGRVTLSLGFGAFTGVGAKKIPVRSRQSTASVLSEDDNYQSAAEVILISDSDEEVPIAAPRPFRAHNAASTPARRNVAPPPPPPPPMTELPRGTTTPTPKKSSLMPPPTQRTPAHTPATPSRPISTPTVQTPTSGNFRARLNSIWPTFPLWLYDAPLAVAWEMTRIGVHCKVDLSTLNLSYNKAWETSHGIETMWKDLRRYDEENPVDPSDTSLVNLRFKSFPEKPSVDAFIAALDNFESRGNQVVMVATLAYNDKASGPLYRLEMKPLKLEKGCRLSRRFGADRFLEMLIPSPTAYNSPFKKIEGAPGVVIDWVTGEQHSLAGRKWRSFYTKDAGYRRQKTDVTLATDPKPVHMERVHLFAEDGLNFRATPEDDESFVPAIEEAQELNFRTEFKVSRMLDWLLQITANDKNRDQPVYKLFSRIQLGLTKTTIGYAFLDSQVHCMPEDLLSPTGKVMNDGIGRMSVGAARAIRDSLGLSEIPSAVQGRIGPAKGMWIRDVRDDDDETIWIETYPSQRKWECNDDDPHHYILEVKDVARELSSSTLNLQFLPVLEDRAIDKPKMRRAIGDRLERDLQREFEDQSNAFKTPLHFKQWLGKHFSTRKRRVDQGYVPMLGGLPESQEEILNWMLNSGFDPARQHFMTKMVYNLQKQKCEELRSKMKIQVGRSAYIYMTIDFEGVLEEGEVHLGFSNKFNAEGDDTSFTLLANCDVLVARSPAHFPSDIQKVKAVFRPELHSLKDVIIFSRKGNTPLADKLSGGDYDGDLAWVCWDPEIVDNFRNADVPKEPDLDKYLEKDETKFSSLIPSTPRGRRRAQIDPASIDEAIYAMISKSFQFAMLPDFLGICTNYKERLCYMNNSVSNRPALILSSLVGRLVDQSKQGIIFTDERWRQLRRDHCGDIQPPDPLYKGNHAPEISAATADSSHIIDLLKFGRGIPAINLNMKALETKTIASGSANAWDPDLVLFYNQMDDLTPPSTTIKQILSKIKVELEDVYRQWQVETAKSSQKAHGALPWSTAVARTHQAYQHIALESMGIKVSSSTGALFLGSWMADPSEESQFALLKASTAFKCFYNRNPTFVWNMAGRQLCKLKALATNGGQLSGHLSTLVPLMNASMTTDQKFVKQYLAREDKESRDGLMDLDEGGEPGEYDGY